jgi:pimeloyl-ACP methyl ester carboxylesterase
VAATYAQRRVVLHGQELACTEWTTSDRTSSDRKGESRRDALPLVLVHGVGSSSSTWDEVAPRLADRGLDVLTLDLPGHGSSASERGDYSLGAMASTIRDLLDHLGHERCIFVGHSLGGGIGMQFAYQFPTRTAGLVLVASGGLGREASPLLRAASLPGAELVLPIITASRTVRALGASGRLLGRLRGNGPLLDDESLTTLRELAEPARRAAFLATLRSVVDVSGQRVSALSKLPTASHLPTLLVWGDRDPIIPLAHGLAAVELLPYGRLVVFPGAGHEPHRHDPERFVDVLSDHAARVQVALAVAIEAGGAPLAQSSVSTSAAARSPVRKAPSISPDQGPAVHSPASTSRRRTRASRSGSSGSPAGQAPATG